MGSARGSALVVAAALSLGGLADARPGRTSRLVHTATELPSLGPTRALVTIELFADLADGYGTGQLHTMLRALAARHPRRLRVIYRLGGRDEHAGPHLLAALEAHAAGRFIEFVDKLYAATLRTPRAELLPGIAELAGVDPARVTRALEPDSPRAVEGQRVAEQSYLLRRRHGIRRSPALLVNGVPLDRRPYSLDDLEAIYDEARATAEARVAAGVRLADVPAVLAAERLRATPEPSGGGAFSLDGPDPLGEVMPPRPRWVSIDRRRGDVLGPVVAPLTITFYCGLHGRNCRASAAALADLGRAYPTEVRVVFRHLHDPSAPDGDRSGRLARAAWCAARAGRFVAFFDSVASGTGREVSVEDAALDQRAIEVGLDAGRFRRCLGAAATARAVAAEVEASRREVGSRAPALAIGRRLHLGSRSFEELSRMVDRALLPGVLGTALGDPPLAAGAGPTTARVPLR